MAETFTIKQAREKQHRERAAHLLHGVNESNVEDAEIKLSPGTGRSCSHLATAARRRTPTPKCTSPICAGADLSKRVRQEENKTTRRNCRAPFESSVFSSNASRRHFHGMFLNRTRYTYEVCHLHYCCRFGLVLRRWNIITVCRRHSTLYALKNGAHPAYQGMCIHPTVN